MTNINTPKAPLVQQTAQESNDVEQAIAETIEAHQGSNLLSTLAILGKLGFYVATGVGLAACATGGAKGPGGLEITKEQCNDPESCLVGNGIPLKIYTKHSRNELGLKAKKRIFMVAGDGRPGAPDKATESFEEMIDQKIANLQDFHQGNYEVNLIYRPGQSGKAGKSGGYFPFYGKESYTPSHIRAVWEVMAQIEQQEPTEESEIIARSGGVAVSLSGAGAYKELVPKSLSAMTLIGGWCNYTALVTANGWSPAGGILSPDSVNIDPNIELTFITGRKDRITPPRLAKSCEKHYKEQGVKQVKAIIPNEGGKRSHKSVENSFDMQYALYEMFQKIGGDTIYQIAQLEKNQNTDIAGRQPTKEGITQVKDQ